MPLLTQFSFAALGVLAYICLLDRNVVDWLYLCIIVIPLLSIRRWFWWLRLYPRLQMDRLHLFLRFKRKDSVTESTQISDRHLRMAKEIMEQLNDNRSK